jgi:threonine-phosphate decarboxylase
MPARVKLRRSERIPTTVHGGDVDQVARTYGVSPDRLIDFSANINPIGPPRRALIRLAREAADCRLLTRYPDPDYVELRNTLAAALRVPANGVTVANGSVALIAAIVRAIAPGECLLAAPVFAEYPRALGAGGCRVRLFPLDPAHAFTLDAAAFLKMLERYRPPLCVLTNPHNPSGALTPRPQMLRVLDGARRTKTWLVVDEAFMDYAPTDTLVAEAVRSEHLVVLRSVTKFYGMPAMRVGYAVSSPRVAARIVAQLPPWPVTTLAASAAVEAVQDQQYARRTLAWAADQRRWLSQALGATGVSVYPSAANFLLLQLPTTAPTSARVRARLITDHGVLVRDCRSFDGLSNGRFIRVAVRQRNDNERLVRALGSVLEGVTYARRSRERTAANRTTRRGMDPTRADPSSVVDEAAGQSRPLGGTGESGRRDSTVVDAEGRARAHCRVCGRPRCHGRGRCALSLRRDRTNGREFSRRGRGRQCARPRGRC